jgi:hypothetical protein
MTPDASQGYLERWFGGVAPARQRGARATQQRSPRRSPCQFEVACHTSHGSFLLQVTDLSRGGLRARIPVRLQPGDMVCLAYPRKIGQIYDEITARVAWCSTLPDRSGIEAGFTFLGALDTLSQSWVDPLLRSLDPELVTRDLRRHLRVSTSLRAEVTLPTDMARDPMEGRVVNLSCGGVLFVGDDPLDVGTPVTVLLELPEKRRPLVCRGEVVRSQWSAAERSRRDGYLAERSSSDRYPGGSCCAAIRFEHRDPSQIEALNSVVGSLL